MAFRYERTRTLVSHVKKKVSQKSLFFFCRKLVKMYIFRIAFECMPHRQIHDKISTGMVVV